MLLAEETERQAEAAQRFPLGSFVEPDPDLITMTAAKHHYQTCDAIAVGHIPKDLEIPWTGGPSQTRIPPTGKT